MLFWLYSRLRNTLFSSQGELEARQYFQNQYLIFVSPKIKSWFKNTVSAHNMLPTVFISPCLGRSSTLLSFPTQLFSQGNISYFCLFTHPYCLKSVLKLIFIKPYFSPLFIHKVHICFNSETGFMKKMKGFLNAKRLYSCESVKVLKYAWYCVERMTLYQQERARDTNPQALEMGRQDSPRHWIKHGVSFHFLHHHLVSTSHTAPWLDHRAESISICIW